MFYGFKVNVCMGYKLFWCFKITYFYSSGTIQVLLPGNCWRAERPAKFRSLRLRWVTWDGQQISLAFITFLRHLYAMVKQPISLTLFFSCRKICSAVWLVIPVTVDQIHVFAHVPFFVSLENGSAASRSRSRWHHYSNMNTILLPPPTQV